MKIDIVGRGNVGMHLLKAFNNAGMQDVNIINPHTLEGLDAHSDLILIAVADSAIESVAGALDAQLSILPSGKLPIIAHTSGATSMNILSVPGTKYGVFYPLQTFSKGVDLNYSEIPIFIEGNDNETSKTLENIAKLISDKVYYANSEQRHGLHLASVLACNFVNHLWSLSEDILNRYNLDFSVMRPLIEETMRKANTHSPSEVQTGPASRLDYNTIESHLAMLQNNPALHNIYSLLSESIINKTKEIKSKHTGLID